MREIKLDIFKKLSKYPKRLNHVIEVSNIAGSLANAHNVPINDARLAGLAHDYSKYENNSFYYQYISEDLIEKYKDDKYMYHAISASNYFLTKYNINNNIYNAIYYHVTGRPNMTKLEQIIFISDSIYFSKKYNTTKLYKIALKDLNKATIYAIKLNEERLIEKGLSLSMLQKETLKYYEELI